MKNFDHEPSISELLDLFEVSEIYVPEFIPCPEDEAIKKVVKTAMRKTFSYIMLS